MRNLNKVIAISGSIKQSSTNLSLINAIIKLFKSKLDFTIFQRLSNIPHFNPDLDTANPPKNVSDFRRQLHEADGILICTPEYAMGVPGTLKNAIDWTVSSMEFWHKPVALITASSAGQKGHQSLLETLRILESNMPASSQLLISFAQAKIKDDKIIDAGTMEEVKEIMDSLINTIDKKKRINNKKMVMHLL
jgi:NAD(P)H-dependent FMN reductase